MLFKTRFSKYGSSRFCFLKTMGFQNYVFLNTGRQIRFWKLWVFKIRVFKIWVVNICFFTLWFFKICFSNCVFPPAFFQTTFSQTTVFPNRVVQNILFQNASPPLCMMPPARSENSNPGARAGCPLKRCRQRGLTAQMRRPARSEL